MKIIIGVDDSPHSNAALEFVKSMKWPAGSSVIVATAVRPLVMAYTEVYVPAASKADGVTEELIRSHQELAARAEQRLQASGLTTRATVLQGDPREVLVDLVKAERPDLLVVGSHGRTGFAKLMLGSVASHLVTHAPCSVLVVKKDGTR